MNKPMQKQLCLMRKLLNTIASAELVHNRA